MDEEEPRVVGELWVDEDAPNVRVERDEDGNFLRAYVWPDASIGEQSEPGPLPEGWKEVGYTTEGPVFVGDAKVAGPLPPRCAVYVKGIDSIERQCIRSAGHVGRHA